MDVQAVAERIEVDCVQPSEQRFEVYASDLQAENEDRADMLARMADRRFGSQRQKLREQLRIFMEEGPERLVPATKGRLRALAARADHRKREIEADRILTFGPPETICVGIIRVDAA